MVERRFIAAALALLLAVSAPAGALANQNGNNDDNERRDTQSRHETGPLNHLPLVFADQRFMNVVRVVVMLRTVTYVSAAAFGIDFESTDRVGIDGLPVSGGLFEKTYRADDFTSDNRIGSVFRDGDDTMAVVLAGDTPLDGQRIVVFNGKGQYTVRERPKITDISPSQLTDLGALPTMQQLLRGQAAKETVQMLTGLLLDPAPETNTPALADMPLLRQQFIGTAHEGDDDTLLIMIRPSLVMGDES
ncbi:MAG: hypothetical protein ACFB13_23025 [Kiloniellaceae bacterium]